MRHVTLSWLLLVLSTSYSSAQTGGIEANTPAQILDYCAKFKDSAAQVICYTSGAARLMRSPSEYTLQTDNKKSKKNIQTVPGYQPPVVPMTGRFLFYICGDLTQNPNAVGADVKPLRKRNDSLTQSDQATCFKNGLEYLKIATRRTSNDEMEVWESGLFLSMCKGVTDPILRTNCLGRSSDAAWFGAAGFQVTKGCMSAVNRATKPYTASDEREAAECFEIILNFLRANPDPDNRDPVRAYRAALHGCLKITHDAERAMCFREYVSRFEVHDWAREERENTCLLTEEKKLEGNYLFEYCDGASFVEKDGGYVRDSKLIEACTKDGNKKFTGEALKRFCVFWKNRQSEPSVAEYQKFIELQIKTGNGTFQYKAIKALEGSR
jgi:hypothetical protein